MVTKNNYPSEQVGLMIRKVAIIFFLSIVISCSNERSPMFYSKNGFRIQIYEGDNTCLVFINPKDTTSPLIEVDNCLKLRLSGGVVPLNHLILARDSGTHKVYIGYTGSVEYMHLDSNYVFLINDNDVCSNFGKPLDKRNRYDCTDLNLSDIW
jgi:hypothetical protein